MPASTLALSLSLLSSSARTIDGERLALPADAELAVVTYSADCGACRSMLEIVHALQAQGIVVVALNTDDATHRAEVLAHRALIGLDIPVVADADGNLRQSLGLSEEATTWRASTLETRIARK